MLLESHSGNMQTTPLKFIQLSAMPIDQSITIKKKLKVKLSRVRSEDEKSIESEHERPITTLSSVVEMMAPRNSQNIAISGSCEFNQQSSCTSVYATTFGQELKATPATRWKTDDKNHSSDEKEVFLAGKPKNGSLVRCTGKRGPETRLCGQKLKKVKIGSRVMQQCGSLLRKLMNHQYGFVFNQPVDPVALQIPDYFDIISEPMDLGTIKKKLENGLYSSTNEFAADVRLTFSNAMKYNPPTNWVHELAGELSRTFNSGWKSLKSKWNVGKSDVGQLDKTPIYEERPSKAAHVKELCPKSAASFSDTLPMLSLTFAQKQKLEKDLMELSKRELPQKLLGPLRKLGLVNEKEDKIAKFDNLDGEIAWELQRVVRSYFKSNTEKFAETGGTCGQNSLPKDLHTDMDSERSTGGENNYACQDEMFDMEYSTKRDDNGETTVPGLYSADCPNTTYSVQLSPSKALRAAMLRSRFVDTIIKAQQKTLLSNGEKINPIMMKRERERMEKKQREEKLRIEAELKAAETASRVRLEAELKLQRQKEREAARLALQQMEQTVEINENLSVLKDLEMLFGCFESGYATCSDRSTMDGFDAITGAFHDRVLERLGLFLKDEFIEVDDEGRKPDVEEGEIAL
ncbi:hypothetical protein Scep_027258 [Stephania cephalantha]|uniref:Bromo domain-containing protein n=1 Tax=Stephania cephalantha TaxID=152367 RepID=A0AAP0E7N8_9MAGN